MVTLRKGIDWKLYKVGIVTLSDKGSKGERKDQSGPLIKQMLPDSYKVVSEHILPDEKLLIEQLLISESRHCDLILTTGGTGLSKRDVTPEATLAVADRIVPGISEGLRSLSIQSTTFAMLGRGVSVLRGETLIINLPGSPKAVKENLDFLLPVLSHALDVCQKDALEHSVEVEE